MRGALQDAYDDRGNAFAHLWCSYSIKGRRDVVFTGDLRFQHFIYCESEPTYKYVNYSPNGRTVEIGKKRLFTGLNAEVITQRNVLLLHEVRSVDAIKVPERSAQFDLHMACRIAEMALDGTEYKAVEHQVFTEKELVLGNEMRLLNWTRLIPWIAQSRYHSLDRYRNTVAACIDTRQEIDARVILALGKDEGEAALFMAAAIEGVAFGDWASDLESRPFGKNTVFKGVRSK